MILRKKFKLFSVIFFLILAFFSSVSFASADVSIRATVPDLIAPSSPILIAPDDGSLLTDNTPSFRWFESTDNVALSHYALYLNDVLYYNNIPKTDTENSSYILDYDELNGSYSLTPKQGIADNSYTWRIDAVDYANLRSSSDTWDFRIDTLAPSFILKKIGDTDVNISAGDAGSVPGGSILIFTNDPTANEPTLIAIGEANSSVFLTVTIPDDPTQNFTGSIDGNGNYELKLGILPRDTDIRLDFIITDQAGHVSVLEGVYFRISLQYWPTSTPSPTPSSTSTVTPSVSLSTTLSPTRTPSISPTKKVSVEPSVSKSPTPTGIVPIIPPKEIIHEVSDELIETLPDSTASYIRNFLTSTLWKNLSLVFILLIILLFYLFSFLILISKFFSSFSTLLVKKILVLLFPSFFKAKKHLVFEYKDTLASPLVKVELLGEDGQLLDFAITNLDGNFDDFSSALPKQWKLRIKDANFYYPIGDERPKQLNFLQFYQNQLINEDYHGQAILIPTLRAAGQEKLPFFENLRIFILYLLDYPLWFLITCLLISLIFAMRYQSIYNTIALFIYIFILLYKFILLFRKKSKLTIEAKMQDGQQLSDNLILSFFGISDAQSYSMVMPFDFSKSKEIVIPFGEIELTAFAKRFALTFNNLIVDKQNITLSKNKEEISLQIKRI